MVAVPQAHNAGQPSHITGVLTRCLHERPEQVHMKTPKNGTAHFGHVHFSKIFYKPVFLTHNLRYSHVRYGLLNVV